MVSNECNYIGTGLLSKHANSNFTGNTATDYGGAVYFYQGTGTVSNCNFINNTASYWGGAIYFYDNSIGNVTNCNFTNNSANYGGSVYFYQGTGSMTNCNFTDNSANNGGAVYFYQGTGSVTNCNLSVYRFDCVMVHEIVSNISQIFLTLTSIISYSKLNF